MYFAKHPAEIGIAAAWCGVIHEAGHYLADQSPARDMTDEAAATKVLWKYRSTEPEHGPRWLRAATHLAFRAARVGNIGVSFQMLLGQYAPAAAIAGSLRPEIQQLDVPIETILATSPPAKFTQLCDSSFGTRPTPAPATQPPPRTRPKPKQVHVMQVGGRLVFTGANLDDCGSSNNRQIVHGQPRTYYSPIMM